MAKEKAFLFGVETPESRWPIEDSLEELRQLARTAGLDTVGYSYQRRETAHPATYMGPGKLEELADEVAAAEADILLTDDELSPAQARNIERKLAPVKVVDRTALILDIFAQHATTKEGQLQVELAQYEYLLPRLSGMWTHLERQAGGRRGGVGLRGPGETQLETDRRLVRRRIAALRRQLEVVRTHRQQYRDKRRRAGAPVIALAGYTNAGKSTLLNQLTSAEVPAVNQLFATLDPTTRRVRLPSGGIALLTDTVGFINKLPHEVVAAFRATLEEITEAEVILLVVDASHPMAEDQLATARSVLEQIGAPGERVLTVWNKIDNLSGAAAGVNGEIRISARTGAGLPGLLESVESLLAESLEEVSALIPYVNSSLLNDIRQQGVLLREEHQDEGTFVEARVPPRLAAQLRNGSDGHGRKKAGRRRAAGRR